MSRTDQEILEEIRRLDELDRGPHENYSKGCEWCHAIHTLRWVLGEEEQSSLLLTGPDLVARPGVPIGVGD